MPDALGGANPVALSWRQYRLERRMFWRNPSAAFFNFVLPLLFLAAGGAILSGNQHQLNKLVPAIAAPWLPLAIEVPETRSTQLPVDVMLTGPVPPVVSIVDE